MSDYWKQFEGKSVPLKDLLQWLSDEHEHVTDDEGELLEGWDYPVVNSMALHRWAITEATPVEYEYGATWLDWHGDYFPVLADEWGTLDLAQAEAKDAKLRGLEGIKIMRRLKAGEVEDFDV